MTGLSLGTLWHKYKCGMEYREAACGHAQVAKAMQWDTWDTLNRQWQRSIDETEELALAITQRIEEMEDIEGIWLLAGKRLGRENKRLRERLEEIESNGTD